MTSGDARLEVTVNVGDFEEAPEALLGIAVRRTLEDAGRERAELSLTLLDDEAIRAMNRDYLERDRTTDVIAFSLGDGEAVLGDVYVGCEQAARQAEEHGVGLDEELVRLAIHGTLHVLGHDHPEGEGRVESAMYRLQERLVAEVVGGR